MRAICRRQKRKLPVAARRLRRDRGKRCADSPIDTFRFTPTDGQNPSPCSRCRREETLRPKRYGWHFRECFRRADEFKFRMKKSQGKRTTNRSWTGDSWTGHGRCSNRASRSWTGDAVQMGTGSQDDTVATDCWTGHETVIQAIFRFEDEFRSCFDDEGFAILTAIVDVAVGPDR